MTVNPADKRPPFQQIADDLRQAIESGELPPGSQLPALPELVERYGVTTQTARLGVNELKNIGLVITKSGVGNFVREKSPVVRLGTERYSRQRRLAGQAAQQAEAEDRGLSWRQEVLELAEVPAPGWVAEWFGIDPGTIVFKRSRREWMDDAPNQIADSYYQLDVVRETPIVLTSTGPGGSYARLEEMGHILTKFREEISVRMPTTTEQLLLRLPSPAPVAVVHRVAFTEAGPVEVFESVMIGDRVVFVYDFPAPE